MDAAAVISFDYFTSPVVALGYFREYMAGRNGGSCFSSYMENYSTCTVAVASSPYNSVQCFT